jgi:hypothetical protein
MRAVDPRFQMLLGSDSERDGIFLELAYEYEGYREVFLEVFRSEADGTLTFNVERPCELPFAVVEKFVQRARAELAVPASTGE